MQRKLQQIKWARKVLRSKTFVVMTDMEGFIYMDALDPESITDQNTLLAQQVEVELFIDRLTAFAKLHDAAIDKMTGGRAASIKVQRGRKPTAKKVTKIPVKQG